MSETCAVEVLYPELRPPESVPLGQARIRLVNRSGVSPASFKVALSRRGWWVWVKNCVSTSFDCKKKDAPPAARYWDHKNAELHSRFGVPLWQ